MSISREFLGYLLHRDAQRLTESAFTHAALTNDLAAAQFLPALFAARLCERLLHLGGIEETEQRCQDTLQSMLRDQPEEIRNRITALEESLVAEIPGLLWDARPFSIEHVQARAHSLVDVLERGLPRPTTGQFAKVIPFVAKNSLLLALFAQCRASEEAAIQAAQRGDRILGEVTISILLRLAFDVLEFGTIDDFEQQIHQDLLNAFHGDSGRAGRVLEIVHAMHREELTRCMRASDVEQLNQLLAEEDQRGEQYLAQTLQQRLADEGLLALDDDDRPQSGLA
ncbi:MAG: hypothetical protein KDD69_08635 [Bdellovibrionales bacterium]|nr:hypothetical protein [Bdellovibrionales bacterium]